MSKRTAALVGIVGALAATIGCITSFFVWQSPGHNKGQNLCRLSAPGGAQTEFHQQLDDPTRSDEQEKRLVGLTARKAQLTRYAVFFQQIHRAQLARLQAVNQELIVNFDVQPDRHYTYDPDAKAVYRVCLEQPMETSRSTALK